MLSYKDEQQVKQQPGSGLLRVYLACESEEKLTRFGHQTTLLVIGQKELSMFNRFIVAASMVTVVSLFAGWATAQEVSIPKGFTCNIVKTTITTDSKGRLIIDTKKVCSK